MFPLSRRTLLAGALAAPLSLADQLKGGIKLTMPAGNLSDESLNFILHLGVEWVTTGGPGAPTYNDEGRVITRAAGFEAPWKEADVRRIKERVEAAGLKVGNLMLHDFRDAILGRPGADQDI